MTEPTCNHCQWWKRMADDRGNCWNGKHTTTVPQRRYEHESCSLFVDQLANRADWPFKEAK
jgi:hypothetical protein